MKIKYLRDTSSAKRTCPTLYLTERGTFIVQGKKIDEPSRLRSYGLRENESAVEVPAKLLDELADVSVFPPQEVGDGLALIRAVPHGARSSSVSATSRGSFIVRGARVIDPEALGSMDIPDDETAVEVPRELLFEVGIDAA